MSFRPLLLSLPLALASCVVYTEAPAEPAATAARLAARAGGTFSFAAAVRLAFAQNPALQALEARARAAGAVTVPTELQSEYRTDTKMLAVMVDPVALLGLGPRGGAQGVAAAEAEAAVQELAAARWRVAAAIAEAYLVDGALAALEVPELALAGETFAQAGLAAPVVDARWQAAAARARAEAGELRAMRLTNRAALAEQLGLPAGTPLELVPLRGDELGAGRRDTVLQRPDLALAAARYRVADAEFRAAVRDQYPSLMVGPEIPLRGDPLQAMAILKLPLGASGRAAAAGERREAARADLAAAWLAADREVAATRAEAAAAAASADAAAAGYRASASAYRAAATAVTVDPDPAAFAMATDAAGMLVRDAMERRTAAVGAARALVRAAVAAGWPAQEVQS